METSITKGDAGNSASSLPNPKARPYLANRVIIVQPTPSALAWKGIVVNFKEKEKDAFSFKGVVKTWDLPLRARSSGGGLVNILDDFTPKYVGKYQRELTEKAFFEAELGVNLNVHAPAEENFWKRDLAGRHKVAIRAGEEKTLDLKTPLGMLHYKILKANSGTFVEGWDVYEKTRINTVLFVLTDAESVRNSALTEGELKGEAWEYYSQIKGSIPKMKDFFRVRGERKAPTASQIELAGTLISILNAPEGHLSVLKIKNDPYFDSKVLLAKLTEVGELRYVLNAYQTEGGSPIGNMQDTLSWLNNPLNAEAVERMKMRLEQ